MLPKTFRVAAGYKVVKGHVAFGAGLAVDVEHGEQIAIHALADRGGPDHRIGVYAYEDLRTHAPPRGLLVYEA